MSPTTLSPYNDLLDRYSELLGEIDRWFTDCISRHPDRISCRHGCSECCRGLFDITLLDALLLQRGFQSLPEDLQQTVRQSCRQRLDALTRVDSRFSVPWLLNSIPEEEWEALMPEEDETPCVMLSAEGSCLVYDSRPMTCRLNGIPLIDSDGEELFDEWCTLNFTDAADDGLPDDLRHPFKKHFAQELLLFRELTSRLLGRPVHEIDTFIPAAPFLEPATIRSSLHEKGIAHVCSCG